MKNQTLKMQKPIVLIGMMGSGKTFAGAGLAQKLDVPFYDADALIEQEQKQKISEIFEHKGEAYFRQIEAEKILSLLKQAQPCVISTGGGAVTTPEVLKAIKEKSFSIWLKADVKTILKRIGNDTNRPLLAGADRETRLSELLNDRTALYQQADMTFDTTPYNPETVADALYKALAGFSNIG